MYNIKKFLSLFTSNLFNDMLNRNILYRKEGGVIYYVYGSFDIIQINRPIHAK